ARVGPIDQRGPESRREEHELVDELEEARVAKDGIEGIGARLRVADDDQRLLGGGSHVAKLGRQGVGVFLVRLEEARRDECGSRAQRLELGCALLEAPVGSEDPVVQRDEDDLALLEKPRDFLSDLGAWRRLFGFEPKTEVGVDGADQQREYKDDWRHGPDLSHRAMPLNSRYK